ncbi:MAG: SDR family NAD(P)-dependent oxidoreductase, partial [Burkholderiales bacterium]
MNRVDGRIALVTGAAGGIGPATCRLLAEGGARVIATALREAPSASRAAAPWACRGALRFLRHDVA